MVKLNLNNSSIKDKIIYEKAEEVAAIHKILHKKANDESEFLGWIELPTNYDKKEFSRIKKAAKKINKDSDVLVVIGIGGSYLGARAVIDSLTHSFYNSIDESKRKTPIIVYAGNNLSPVYINDLLDFISDKDISVNVISKSGTTTEPAIAFRIFREVLETKYGVEEARKRIYVTTDKKRGALKTLSTEEGYETVVAAKNDYENGMPDIPNCDCYIDIPFARNPFSFRNIKAYKMLKTLIDNGDFDVVQCNTPVGSVLGRLAARKARKKGTKVVYIAHGFHFFKGSSILSWLMFYPVEKLLSYITDVLITINTEDYERALKKFHAKTILHINGIGVGLNKIESCVSDRHNIRAGIGIKDNEIMLVSVGELINRKNQQQK